MSRARSPSALPLIGPRLLLRGCRCEARFLLPASSLGEPGSLEGVRLLPVTPMPVLSAERGGTFSAPFGEAPRIAELAVLEPILSPGGALIIRGGARAESERGVPWRCRAKSWSVGSKPPCARQPRSRSGGPSSPTNLGRREGGRRVNRRQGQGALDSERQAAGERGNPISIVKGRASVECLRSTDPVQSRHRSGYRE